MTEDEKTETPDAPPKGSWRQKLRDFEPETATMEWDDEQWEIPAKMPNSYYDALRTNDFRGAVISILGTEGMRRLRLPSDIDAETMGELVESIATAAGEVWDIPNLNRSARRSRGIAKH